TVAFRCGSRKRQNALVTIMMRLDLRAVPVAATVAQRWKTHTGQKDNALSNAQARRGGTGKTGEYRQTPDWRELCRIKKQECSSSRMSLQFGLCSARYLKARATPSAPRQTALLPWRRFGKRCRTFCSPI